MNNYIITKDTPILKVSGGVLVKTPDNLWLNKGNTFSGEERYLLMKEGNKVTGTKHVAVIKSNRYIPYELLKVVSENPLSAPKTSSVSGSGLEDDVVQPNLDQSISMMIGDQRGRDINGKANGNGKKKMYLFYQMAVPPYYSINGSEWNEEIGKKLFYGVTGDDWREKIQSRVFFSVTGDKTVIEVTPEEMQKEHEKSGSKKSFKEWIKSSGQDTLLTLGAIAAMIIAAKGGVKTGGEDKPIVSDDSERKPVGDQPTKILGMHPVTFGIVAVITLGAIAFFAFRGGKVAKA